MSDKIKYKLKDGGADKKNEKEAAPQTVFKTEETLKQEARDRLAEEERIYAQKPPQSERRKKIDNYIYHYKWHTIIGIIGLVLIVFFVRDTIFRPKPDLTVVVATSRFLMQSETDALQAALEEVAGDFNGDGKVLVNLDTINLPIAEMMGTAEGAQDDEGMLDLASGSDPEMIQASTMKLMAVISAWSDPLYLLDDDLYNYISAMAGPSTDEEESSDTSGDVSAAPSGTTAASGDASSAAEIPEYAIFEPLLDIPGASGPYGDRLRIKDTMLASAPGFEYLGDAAFSVRPPQNANQKNVDYQEFCVKLLEILAAG